MTVVFRKRNTHKRGKCPASARFFFVSGSCGVVWCGAVWCGVVWCGVVWCGVVWCGVVWCGVVACGVGWGGVGWCVWWRGVWWCGMACGVVWCGGVWYPHPTPTQAACGVCVWCARGVHVWCVCGARGARVARYNTAVASKHQLMMLNSSMGLARHLESTMCLIIMTKLRGKEPLAGLSAVSPLGGRTKPSSKSISRVLTDGPR